MLRLNTVRHARWLLAAATVALCLAQQARFGPVPQPEPSVERPRNVAARVMSMTGRVSVLKGTEPWALNVGEAVSEQQVIVTGTDGYAIFQVNDGSTFEVFPNSRVVFRNSQNWQDLLDVILGRVKVFVQKWGGAPSPARVFTPTAVISVRGTVFDVAHDSDDSTLVSVDEGQVSVRHRLIYNEEPRLVNPGEQIRVYKNVPLAKAKLDKGNLAQRGANALAEAFYTIMLRGPRGGGAGTPGGGPVGLPGDTGGLPPPPPPPPPDGGGAPPPPPPPPND